MKIKLKSKTDEVLLGWVVQRRVDGKWNNVSQYWPSLEDANWCVENYSSMCKHKHRVLKVIGIVEEKSNVKKRKVRPSTKY